jgi:hypothetical protein
MGGDMSRGIKNLEEALKQLEELIIFFGQRYEVSPGHGSELGDNERVAGALRPVLAFARLL